MRASALREASLFQDSLRKGAHRLEICEETQGQLLRGLSTSSGHPGKAGGAVKGTGPGRWQGAGTPGEGQNEPGLKDNGKQLIIRSKESADSGP